jgi:glyoxylase-like metal-dependent hydrolase (beta-lactamase superfamily II)
MVATSPNHAVARQLNLTRVAWGVVTAAVLVLDTPAVSAQDLFELQKVADGVYAALAAPRTPINCNAAVIVYDDGVLVVDTHSRPSSARALIGQIGRLTDKPVRYAVNTHFHWDHAQGNHAYPVAFPRQVTVVASESTRENLRALGMERVKDQLDRTPRQVEELRRKLAGETEASAQDRLRDEIRQQLEYLAEMRSLELVLPDLTFDKTMILHRKDMDIVLLFLGRGHTNGDVVAYLPKQRVVATGDLLHGWMPFMGDSYPPEWVATLDALEKLEFDHVIGGHGTVKPKSHLRVFRNYIADLVEEVRRARGRGQTLEQAKTSVAAALQPKHASGMGEAFDESVGENIEKVYKDLEAKRY